MISARQSAVSLHPSSATRSGDATSGFPFQYAVGTLSAHLVARAPALMLLNSLFHGSMFVSGLHCNLWPSTITINLLDT
jgi:hypothetical protein